MESDALFALLLTVSAWSLLLAFIFWNTSTEGGEDEDDEHLPGDW